jgi:cardiolipin synthase
LINLEQINFAIYLEIVYILVVIFVCLRIIYEINTNSKTLSYLLLVIFLPFVGIVIYFCFGNDYRKNKIYSKKLSQNDNLFKRLRDRIFKFSLEIIHSNTSSGLKNHLKLAHLLLQDGSPLTNNNTVKLLVNGENAFPAIIEALKEAKHHIHLEYYIYENDNIGNEIKDILIDKAKQGVKVRFIYDDFGSRDIDRKFTREMEEVGAEIYPFYKINFIKLANRINYRNHRKIIIIDGLTSFIGGINVSDKYVNPNPDNLYWRDTHMMIKGSGTSYLQYTFLCDWNFCAEQQVDTEPYFFRNEAVSEGHTVLQIASSGPDSDRPTILYSLIQAISEAKKEILITTPYFIPDESLISAIKIVSLSGVDVKLIVPKKADSFLVNAAACSYYSELLQSGVHIYLYNKGFIHAKTIVIDEELSMLGTANMDVRSFELNFEVNAVVYDSKFSMELKASFHKDLKHCDKIDPEVWNLRSNWKTLPEKVARLFSPLL